MPTGLPTRFVVIVPPPPRSVAPAQPSQSGQAPPVSPASASGGGWPAAVTWVAIAAIVGVTLWYFGPVVGAAAGVAAAKLRGARKPDPEHGGFDMGGGAAPSAAPELAANYSFGDMAKEAPQIGGFEFGDIAREDVLRLVGGDLASRVSDVSDVSDEGDE